jgi:hypothetical protein
MQKFCCSKCTNLLLVSGQFIVLESKETLTRFEFLVMLKMRIFVFWVVTICSLVSGHQCFQAKCYLHLYGRIYTTQKARSQKKKKFQNTCFLKGIIILLFGMQSENL